MFHIFLSPGRMATKLRHSSRVKKTSYLNGMSCFIITNVLCNTLKCIDFWMLFVKSFKSFKTVPTLFLLRSVMKTEKQPVKQSTLMRWHSNVCWTNYHCIIEYQKCNNTWKKMNSQFIFNKRKNICKQPCLSGTRKSTCVNVQEKRNSTHNCKDCNTTCWMIKQVLAIIIAQCKGFN